MGSYSEENDPFCHDIKSLTYLISRLSIHNEEIDDCLTDVFDDESPIETKESFASSYVLFISKVFKGLASILKHILTCCFMTLFIYLFIISHNSAQKFVMRNCQNYIYPTMRTLRIWTLPVLQNYEFLSGDAFS